MAAASVATPVSIARHAGWIHSPGWDLVWMFAALWGGALVLAGAALPSLAGAVVLAFALERLFSVAHSWSTTWMVVGSSLFADERRARPVRFVAVPALLAAIGLGLGFLVAATQRYPEHGRFDASLWAWGLYLALFWIGHFWHFGNQDFGVLTLYRVRAGQNRPIDRRIDKLYTAAMMFAIQPLVYVSLVSSNAFSEMVLTLLPVSPATARTAAGFAVAIAGALAVGVIGFELSKRNRSLPRLLYLGVVFLHPTLLYASIRSGRETLALLYVVAYLWSHWFIAIGLVGRINSRYYQSRGDRPTWALVRHAALLAALAGLVFIATQAHQEFALFNTAGFRYKALLASIQPAQTLVIGAVLGFFLAEQLVHYWCDRCLFRLRDPSVRRKVAPLLLGGRDV
jgi:hypothetical protein